VTSFTVQVPAGAKPPQSLILDATAEDRAGNVGAAARVILPVADNVLPTLTALHTDTGRLDIARGRSVTIVVDAEDDLGVSEIDLQGSGAFSVTTAKPIAPPLGTASASFAIQVPGDVVPGTIFTVQATAVDLAGNSSAPMTLANDTTADVSFGPSVIVDAGVTAQLAVQLATAAPPAYAHRLHDGPDHRDVNAVRRRPGWSDERHGVGHRCRGWNDVHQCLD
jgi:hypothetical protein